jgi:hypothetical protein
VSTPTNLSDNSRLLGYAMAMQRKHGGWEEAVWETWWELRWSESDRGAGDVMDT